MAASPCTRAACSARADFANGDVPTILKNIQLDIGHRTTSWTSGAGSTTPSTESSGSRTAVR